MSSVLSILGEIILVGVAKWSFGVKKAPDRDRGVKRGLIYGCDIIKYLYRSISINMELVESQKVDEAPLTIDDFLLNDDLNIKIQELIAEIKASREQHDIQLRKLKQIEAAKKILIDNQIVYWDYFNSKFIKEILDSNNIDRYLKGLLGKRHSKNVRVLIINCSKLIKSTPVEKIFSESIYAFKKGRFSLCVVGLVSVLDCLLSRSSGNTGTNIENRVKLIIKRIREGFELDSSELSEIVLCSTFCSVIPTLGTTHYFGGPEPAKLNRHWIMHGRSNRDYSAFDCIKLIRVIYALQVINNGFHS